VQERAAGVGAHRADIVVEAREQELRGRVRLLVGSRLRDGAAEALRSEIDQIAVDPVWRRRGVGRALMAAALAEADKRGLRYVELFSWAFNTDAHTLFRGFGFEPRHLRFERRAP